MTSFSSIIAEHQDVIYHLGKQTVQIEAAGALIVETLHQGNKILLCGNGGSASDCQHLATEFMVRYVNQRRPLPAIALTTDTSILTAHTNDFGFKHLFSRQVEALGHSGDCLIAISTSGHSENIIAAVKAAKNKQMNSVILTGRTGGKLVGLSPYCITVPSDTTARIQEAHIVIGHWWCQLADENFSE
ncbi:MAG TPA: SIS domain-containing protein [Leucothrix mucor]|uniref:Phosphoheptose isomerase n=1 Tax=Leucothrix mucor TaxID=45248 RepID=A0A7V2T2X2_LEUMU|nr:SIS domain-containing protein [Leucothrix mucor]